MTYPDPKQLLTFECAAPQLWAHCPECKAIFIGITGKVMMHSCPAQMVPTAPGDHGYPFVSATGRWVELQPQGLVERVERFRP